MGENSVSRGFFRLVVAAALVVGLGAGYIWGKSNKAVAALEEGRALGRSEGQLQEVLAARERRAEAERQAAEAANPFLNTAVNPLEDAAVNPYADVNINPFE